MICETVFGCDPTLFITVFPCGPLTAEQTVAGLPDATYFEVLPVQGNERLHLDACFVAMNMFKRRHPVVALIDDRRFKISIGVDQLDGQVLFLEHWVRVRRARIPRPPVLGEAFCPGGVC
jgi:hypothetical protein